jgi:hypothetical protein
MYLKGSKWSMNRKRTRPNWFRIILLSVLVLAGAQSVFTRFRIEQTVRWWRYAALLVLVQWLVLIVLGKGVFA